MYGDNPWAGLRACSRSTAISKHVCLLTRKLAPKKNYWPQNKIIGPQNKLLVLPGKARFPPHEPHTCLRTIGFLAAFVAEKVMDCAARQASSRSFRATGWPLQKNGPQKQILGPLKPPSRARASRRLGSPIDSHGSIDETQRSRSAARRSCPSAVASLAVWHGSAGAELRW